MSKTGYGQNPDRHSFLKRPLEWKFPAGYCHDGLPLGNGRLGLMAWGEDNRLLLTLGRQDFWDHRGGMKWTSEASFANLLQWTAEGNERKLKDVFEGPRDVLRPSVMPVGRIELTFPGGCRIRRAELDMQSATAEIFIEDGERQYRLSLCLLMDHDAFQAVIRSVDGSTPDPDSIDIRVFPAYGLSEAVRRHFERNGINPPSEFGRDCCRGFIQPLPRDRPLCLACRPGRLPDGLYVLGTALLAENEEAAADAAVLLLESLAAEAASGTDITLPTQIWWREYWAKTASVQLPEPDMEMLYYLGIYKLGCISVPGRIAANLQGPWVEDHRLPPWSNDYHFNVNVQEVYWPAFASNHLETLQPLWDMLNSWRPLMKEFARNFSGAEDGLQVPHAADDRGVTMGGIWAVDHGSTAWTAQLMWLYWKYSADADFLRDTVYPFLKGAFNVYKAMLRRRDDGSLELPLGFSPEFGHDFFTSLGRNPSYQLAMIHFLGRALLEASTRLSCGEDERRQWEEVLAGLPVCCRSSRWFSSNPWTVHGFLQQQKIERDKSEAEKVFDPEIEHDTPVWMGEPIRMADCVEAGEILVWEGQPLSESHRHHSHLAGIYPMDVLDYYPGGRHFHLVHNSVRKLAHKGMGGWSGWCIPWASIIHSRLRNGDMAALLLTILRRFFMRQGYATTHDAVHHGLTDSDNRDFMQLDATLGASNAVMEMLLHTSQGLTRVFPAMPTYWRTASFDGLLCEGGFLLSAQWHEGQTTRLEICSAGGGEIRLENPFFGYKACLCRSEGDRRQLLSQKIISLSLAAGEKVCIQMEQP